MARIRNVKAVLLDLSGTLHVGSNPTPEAPAALARLRSAGVPFRLCSNTTKESEADLLERLRGMGFVVKDDELLTSLGAARAVVKARGFKNPLLLLSDSARRSFSHAGGTEHDCVVVGLAPEELSYPRLNEAFRILKGERRQGTTTYTGNSPKPALIATHKARYFADTDGALSLGPGPFISALEEAADIKAEVLGKPSKAFFEQSLRTLGEKGWENVAMVGDDIRADLGEGAIELGLVRVLVKTGKYRAGDEQRSEKPPDHVVDSFADFVNLLLTE